MPRGRAPVEDDGDPDEVATGPSLVPQAQETVSLLEPVRESARDTLDGSGPSFDEEDGGDRTGPSSTADLDGDEPDAQESIQTARNLKPLPERRPAPREKPPPPVPSQELPEVRELDAPPREPPARRPQRKSPLAGDGFEADARDVPARRARGLAGMSQKVLEAIGDRSPLNVAATVASVVLFLFVAWFLWGLLAR